jgi:fumarate hydratase subunit alpha
MREIRASLVTETVSRLFQDANVFLPKDVLVCLQRSRETEESPLGREVLADILKNAEIAAKEMTPLCQDTGAALVFLELGQDVHVIEGDLYSAVNEGVARGYRDGFLRKSMVRHPFSERTNTKDNTPAIIYTDIVPGDRLKITVMPKGGGAENMTRLGMLLPSAGRQGVIDFTVQAVDIAGSNACPPVIVGIGIGGTADKSLQLSKKALLRDTGIASADPEVADLERDILKHINDLGIGPMGYGGRVTALAVHAEVFPAHIAGLPVAVTLQCHCARHKEMVI